MSEHATGALFPFTHPIPSAEGVTCHVCQEEPASHKVAEVTDDERHELTAYACCACFGMVMGSLALRLCQRAQASA